MKIPRRHKYVRTLVLIYISTYSFTLARKEKCSYVGYRGREDSKNKTECPKTIQCTKEYTISYIDVPPYSTSRIFEGILQTCCKSCVNISTVKLYTNISEVQLSHQSSSHFILPFLGSSTAQELYSYHFIPFTNVPNAYYITTNHPTPISQAIEACLNLYHLIVVCLLAAVISGFVIWCLETRYGNEENFSPSFCTGVFEGFWWSFISMTMVGYGDTLVKSGKQF